MIGCLICRREFASLGAWLAHFRGGCSRWIPRERIEIRIALSGNDFTQLVAGQELVIEHAVMTRTDSQENKQVFASNFPTLRILLSDIGFDFMRRAITLAEHKRKQK